VAIDVQGRRLGAVVAFIDGVENHCLKHVASMGANQRRSV
jgi:hypothetical protein